MHDIGCGIAWRHCMPVMLPLSMRGAAPRGSDQVGAGDGQAAMHACAAQPQMLGRGAHLFGLARVEHRLYESLKLKALAAVRRAPDTRVICAGRAQAQRDCGRKRHPQRRHRAVMKLGEGRAARCATERSTWRIGASTSSFPPPARSSTAWRAGAAAGAKRAQGRRMAYLYGLISSSVCTERMIEEFSPSARSMCSGLASVACLYSAFTIYLVEGAPQADHALPFPGCRRPGAQTCAGCRKHL